MPRSLELDALDVHYGIHTLKGVVFSVDAGQIVTLIGAHGASKTTTLGAISDMVKPSRGRVTFAGQSINANDSGRAPAPCRLSSRCWRSHGRC
jgi:branched-chain amino acid transport system ATP-binding protein